MGISTYCPNFFSTPYYLRQTDRHTEREREREHYDTYEDDDDAAVATEPKKL